MDTGDSPSAGNPRRRNRGSTRGAAYGLPPVDDGGHPNPAPFPIEWSWGNMNRLSDANPRHRGRSRSPDSCVIGSPDGKSRASVTTRGQASYSAAPPSDRPGAERTGRGMRSRRSRHRRAILHVEDPGKEVTNLPTLEALSASGSAGFHSNHPGGERAVIGTRFRQSVLYSNRPRRPRRRHEQLPTQNHPSEVSSSELGGPVTDLPTLEALSLSDQPPLTPQISGKETDNDDDDDDDDDGFSYLYGPGDVGHSIGPIGLTTSMLLSLGDGLFGPVPVEEMRRPDSDEDPEELQRWMKEYSIRNPPVSSLEEGFARILAVQHAALTALAAKKGTEPPRDPFLVDQEAPSLQAQQQDSAAAPHSQDSMAISDEASKGVIQDGKQWMRDEVTLCFRKHVEKTPYLAGLVFELDELCHQCFNVENYKKVFHHYNFKIRMKMPGAVEWTEELYFGEVKEIFGTKFYFCCPLEPNESGHCSVCKNQGVEDLKHPVTGGFEGSNLWY